MAAVIVCIPAVFLLPTMSQIVSAGDVNVYYDGGLFEYADECFWDPCGIISDCIPWDDGSFRCLCAALFSGEYCQDFGNGCFYGDVDDCENAAMCSVVDNSRVCTCIPGTEGDRCQHYTRNHTVDSLPLLTRTGYSWTNDVCVMVGHGSVIDIDIGQSYFISDITVVPISQRVNMTLLAITNPGDPDGHLCTHHEDAYQTLGTPVRLPCPGAPRSQYFRLIMGTLEDSQLHAVCVGGVLLNRFRSGRMTQQQQSVQNVMSTFTSRSRFHCGIVCFETGTCTSFDWDALTHQCTMLGQTTVTDTGTNVGAFFVYRDKN